MDMDNEMLRAKGLLVSGIVFLISSCFAWGELYYALFGKKTQATVTNVSEYTVRGRFGGDRGKNLSINYTFKEENGNMRNGSDTASTDFAGIVNNKVEIDYTAGENGNSRLAGKVNWVALIIFFSSLLGLISFGAWVAKESFANSGKEPKKKKK